MTRKFFALLLAALLLCFVGCGSEHQKNNDAVNAYINMAQGFIDSGDYEAAQTVLKDGVEACGDERLAAMLEKVNEKILNADETTAETTAEIESPEVAAMFSKYEGVWRRTTEEEVILDISFDKENIYIKGSYERFYWGEYTSFEASASKETFFEYGCRFRFTDNVGTSVVALLKPETVEFSDGIWDCLVWSIESLNNRSSDIKVNLYRDSEHDKVAYRTSILSRAGTYYDGYSEETGGNILDISVVGTTVKIEYECWKRSHVACVSHSADITDFYGDSITFDFTDSWGNSGTMKVRLYSSPAGYCADINIYDLVYAEDALWSVSEGKIWLSQY